MGPQGINMDQTTQQNTQHEAHNTTSTNQHANPAGLVRHQTSNMGHTTEASPLSVQFLTPQGLSPGVYSIGSDNTITFTPPQTQSVNTQTLSNVTHALSQIQNTTSAAQAPNISTANPTHTQYIKEEGKPQRVIIKQEKGTGNSTQHQRQLESKYGNTGNTGQAQNDDPSDPSDSDTSTSSSSSTDSDKKKKKYKKKASKKSRNGKKSRKYYSSSSSDSENENSSSSSEDEKEYEPKVTLLSLLQEMTCDSEYADELVLLKTLFTRRSELPELKHTSKNYTPKLTDHFPELYKGNAKRLKRYLTRLLEYTAIKANTHRERADLVSEGPGLSDECLKDIEMAAKIPLPGLGDSYTNDKLSQKKRLLDLLLTYVILFYKDEPTSLHDLKLRGPFLTGLIKLYQIITAGNTQLPAKLIEEYLARAILRSDSADSMGMLRSFQSQLRLQKRLDPTYTQDENKHRRLIYNCCTVLANEDMSLNTNAQVRDQYTRAQHPPQQREQYSRPPPQQYAQQREQYSRPPPPQYQPQREQYPRPQNQQYGQSRVDQYQRAQQHQQYSRSPRPRYEQTYLTDVIDQDDLITKYTNMVLETRNNKDNNETEQTKQDKIVSFQRVFMTKPCRCCGSPYHAMLSNEKSSDGRGYTEYECPASMCEKWADARRSMVKNLKYQINPEKFARMCRQDTNKVLEAWKHYSDNGSGKFKKPNELQALKSSVLSFCKPNNGNLRPQEHRSSSISYSIRPRMRYDNNDHSEDDNDNCNSPTIVAIHTGNVFAHEKSVCGTLHLLIATKVEPATREDIENLNNIETDHMETLYASEYKSIDNPDALRVRLMLPNGESFVVPYTEVQGRILPDTGSTTSLINEEFARSKGLYIEESPYEITLKDVNNGERTINHRCYFRLTITTTTGRDVITILPALCVPDLSHEILLGTKDLERYQVSVVPHLGQAKMMIGYEEMVFPMLDNTSISELQNNLNNFNLAKRC